MKVVQYDQITEPLITPSGEQISELIGKASGDQSNHSLAHIVIPPGKSSAPHYHQLSQESYFMLEGEGQMQVNEHQFVLKPGQVCYIEPGETHQISNQGDGDLVFLAICVPPWVPEDSFEV
jgi:mannose-6-phosphate isomerase-like protein (cupin superfamily)